jgi:hypothetical protein
LEADKNSVTLQCGRVTVPALREKGTFAEAPELEAETLEYARERARRHIGEGARVFAGGARDAVYRGVIAEITPGHAIQKVGDNAFLHRLKDLEPYKNLIQEGADVRIAVSSKGELTAEPCGEREKEGRAPRDSGQSR